jgi:hypothetical protein
MEADETKETSNKNKKGRARFRGLGDTVKWALSKIGLTEKTTKAISGEEDCGCDERRTFLNKIFPYKKNEDK